MTLGQAHTYRRKDVSVKKPLLLLVVLVLVSMVAASAMAQEEASLPGGPEPSTVDEVVLPRFISPLTPVSKPYSLGTDPADAGYYELDEPYDACGNTMLTNHDPGVFLVSYYSEEDMLAAPQENVVETFPRYGWDSPYIQLLRFDDIASIEDPYERLIAEDAKGQEILAWPGVRSVSMNTYGCAA